MALSGFYIGMTQWYNLHMKNGNLLAFSPIQMHGSSQLGTIPSAWLSPLEARVRSIVVRAMRDAFWDLRWYYVFYFIYGG